MTLGFSQQINGKPNRFVEKISIGLLENGLVSFSKLAELSREPLNPLPAEYNYIDTLRNAGKGINPKIHTMRLDVHNRWRTGVDIHMVIGNRTVNRYQFAPIVPACNVQPISFDYSSYDSGKYSVGGWPRTPVINIDGRNLLEHEVLELSENDGFDSIEDFFAYFNTNDSYKIIHWTDKKY